MNPVGQNQKAGSGSQQIQVSGDLVLHQGISEERALEIARGQAQLVLKEYSDEAIAIAQERIEKLDQKVVEILSSTEKLSVLADPSFQISLKKSQAGAAATDRERDFDLLARLLGQRASNQTRYSKVSVDKAIEVIDSLEEPALQALTMLWAIGHLVPGGQDCTSYVNATKNLFGQLPWTELPSGRRWMDHLDMLNLIRIVPNSITQLKKFSEYSSERVAGLFSFGMSESEMTEFEQAFIRDGLPRLQIVPHEAKAGYYRVNIRNKEDLENALTAAGVSPEIAEIVVSLATTQGRILEVDPDLALKFSNEVSQIESLRAIQSWYDAIPDYPQITPAGEALAVVNSKQFIDYQTITGFDAYLASLS